MIRRLIWWPVFASCLGVASAAPESRPNASAVCLYDSKAYSEGAFVCVQKSLMLKCAADDPHMSWKVVPDEDMSDRCTAPTVQHTPPEPRAHPHRRRLTVRNRRPLIEDPAKCFVFNGVQYCE